MGDPIARALGNALIAPIVTLEPGNPERVRMPGTVLLSPETFKAVVSDMAVSLKTQGFKHIVLLGDSGGNIKPLTEAAEVLNAKWKAAGSDVRAYSITMPQLRRSGGSRRPRSASTSRWKGCTTATTSPRSSPCTIRTVSACRSA